MATCVTKMMMSKEVTGADAVRIMTMFRFSPILLIIFRYFPDLLLPDFCKYGNLTL